MTLADLKAGDEVAVAIEAIRKLYWAAVATTKQENFNRGGASTKQIKAEQAAAMDVAKLCLKRPLTQDEIAAVLKAIEG